MEEVDNDNENQKGENKEQDDKKNMRMEEIPDMPMQPGTRPEDGNFKEQPPEKISSSN